MFNNLNNERESLNLDASLAPPAELSDLDLEVVSTGKIYGGVGGPWSGWGVRPGWGWGAPGLGLFRGWGFGGPFSGLGLRPGWGWGAPGFGLFRGPF